MRSRPNKRLPNPACTLNFRSARLTSKQNGAFCLRPFYETLPIFIRSAYEKFTMENPGERPTIRSIPTPLERVVMSAAERQRPAAMPSRPSSAPRQSESARGVVRPVTRAGRIAP